MFPGRGCHGRLHPTHPNQDSILSLGEHRHTGCHSHTDRHTHSNAYGSADRHTHTYAHSSTDRRTHSYAHGIAYRDAHSYAYTKGNAYAGTRRAR